MIVMQLKVQLLSYYWKWHLFSYNIFTIDRQQPFIFFVEKMRSERIYFNKIVKEGIRKKMTTVLKMNKNKDKSNPYIESKN